MSRENYLLAGLILELILCAPLIAKEGDESEVLAGHSYHGEAFNEGPRQLPYLMSGLGQSQFEISTDDAQAQSFFNQGIDQLHGFWYFEAERSFRQVATLDPDCLMAYWGLAMANVNNEGRAKKFLKKAREKSEQTDRKTSEREWLYFRSLETYYDEKTKDKKQRAENFTKKLEEIVLKYPEDIEAKAFLACQVWMNKRQGLNITSHVGINSILDDVFAVNPSHSAHHYRIHLWDYENASVALESAAKCGPSLPDIAHMWHMPGHIYSRLNRYEDAVWQQEASARVDHKNMMKDWVLPDQIHNFAHNNEWCIRNLIHVGRVRDAIDLATNMISLPRHPKYNMLDKNGSSRYGRRRLFQVLSTYELWSELIDSCQNGLLNETELPLEKIKRLRLLGRAYFRSGKIDSGLQILKQIEKELDLANQAIDTAKSEAKVEVDRQTTLFKRLQRPLLGLLPVDVQKFSQRHWHNSIRRDHRRREIELVGQKTKSLNEQVNVTNRAIDELNGYKLVSEERYSEGHKLLKKAGEVDAVYRAWIRHKAGETEQAIEDARKYVKTRTDQVQPLTMLAWLLWECDLRDEALETLSELILTSGSIDSESAFFDRLDPIVEFAGLDQDWTMELPVATDLGERPDLESLGPFRWQPINAPSWALKDSTDQVVSLSQYSGQPVIVIFYLGHGCLHCAEQLQKFAPKMQDFLDAGIEIVAISTDDWKGLKKSIDSYGETPLPIPLVANSEMDVFKLYRAFDEFENQPLHGTYLIDGDGKIRWQDIGFEPFMDPKFLLKEAKRLLGHPVAR